MNSPETASRLRTVVVGLGRIGFGYHCPEVVRHPAFELAGVVDPLEARRDEAKTKWNVPGFATLEEALRASRSDLVMIASPTHLHADQTELAFAQGAHVLCDKPVASSLEEFDRMVAAGARAGRCFVAYQPCRYHLEVRALKALLAENLLGPMHLVRRSRSGYERRQDWQAFRKHGGGMLNNYGSHCVDELQWLTDGREVERVYCQTRCVATAGDAEDFVKASFACAGGLLIDLEISQASALVGPAWEVLGAHGAARWDDARRTWIVRYFDPREVPAPVAQTGLAAAGRLYRVETLPWREVERPAPGDAFDYYDAVWRHLVRGAPAPVTVAETRRLLQLIARCHASAENGQVT